MAIFFSNIKLSNIRLVEKDIKFQSSIIYMFDRVVINSVQLSDVLTKEEKSRGVKKGNI